MPSLFAIADTHFGHRNIIAYTGRPFFTVEAMDTAMIAAWNAVVRDEDWVFHLGDFGLASRAVLRELVSRLRGRKILVMGNNDRCTPSWWRRAGFVQAYRYPVVYDGWIFSHRPLGSVPLGYVNVHGHLHEREGPGHPWCCVSVEQTGYAPIRLADDLPDSFGMECVHPWGSGG